MSNYAESPDPEIVLLRVKIQHPLVAVETEERHREPWWLMAMACLFAITAAMLLVFYVKFYVFF